MAITFELLSPGKYLPPEYWLEQEPTADRVEIEIGPGDGRFLVEAAREHDATLFAGFEARAAAAQSLAARPDLPSNLRVYHGDGRWLVEHILAERTIDAFHIYFPDPWWKKRHHKRRLFTPGFASGLHRCLKARGRVYVITDVARLFDDLSTRLTDAGLGKHDWQRHSNSAGQSTYERKYRRQQRTLFAAYFEKSAQ